MADITEPSIGLTKLALLLLYYRLFSADTTAKIGILAGIVFICICYTTLMFLFIFLSADKTVPVNKTMAIINVLTDSYILVLPIYSLLKLHIPKKRKIGLALVFATGAL
jgi:heme/copper-type cytochrome/quinol oxidase subunit 4